MSDDEKAKEERTRSDEFRKLMFTYAGLQMALVLLVAAAAEKISGSAIIVSLLSISVPSTIALGILRRISQADKRQNPLQWNAAAYILCVVPSITAVSATLASASMFSAIAFPAASTAWVVAILRLRSKKDINQHQ